jgi:hypothetical protein
MALRSAQFQSELEPAGLGERRLIGAAIRDSVAPGAALGWAGAFSSASVMLSSVLK